MVSFFLLIGILVLGALLRFSFARGRTSDGWVATWMMERLESQRWLDYGLQDSVIEGEHGYPQLAYFISSRFPRNWRYTGGLLVNTGADLLVGLLVLSWFFLADVGLESEAVLAGLAPAEAALLLFVTYPALHPPTARLTTVKGRTLGLLAVTLWFLGIERLIVTGTLWWLVPVGLAIWLAISSSQFGFQTIVFFSIVVAVWLSSVIPVLLLAGSISLALAVPPLRLRAPLRHYLSHKIWYLRNHRLHPQIHERNPLRDFYRVPKALLKEPWTLPHIITRKAPWFNAGLLAFLGLGVAGFLIDTGNSLAGHIGLPSESLLSGWLWASLILLVVTAFHPLTAFGQAERYMEYSAPAVAILAPFVFTELASSPDLFIGLFIAQVAIVLGVLITMDMSSIYKPKGDVPEGLARVVDWLCGENSVRRVATVPVKLASALSASARARHPDHKVEFYFQFISRPGDWGFRAHEAETGGLVDSEDGYTRSFQMFSLSLGELADRYEITHIVASKRSIPSLQAQWGLSDDDILNHSAYETEQHIVLPTSDLISRSIVSAPS